MRMLVLVVCFSITAWAQDPDRIVGDEVRREEHHRKEQVFTLTEAERLRRLQDFERMQPIIENKIRQNFLPGVPEGAKLSTWYNYVRATLDDARIYMAVHLLSQEGNRSKFQELDSRRNQLFESIVKNHWDTPAESLPEKLQAFQALVDDVYRFFLELGYQKWRSDQGYDVPVIPAQKK